MSDGDDPMAKILQKIKDQLRREGWAKQNMIRDREERWLLESLIECCEDPTKVAGLARMRLGHLDRRAKKEQGAAQARSEAPDAESSAAVRVAPSPATGQFTAVEETLRAMVTEGGRALGEGHPAASPEYWEALVKGELSVGRIFDGQGGAEPCVDVADLSQLKESLAVGGYLDYGGIEWARHGVNLQAIERALVCLREAGWPAGFIFMYDEVWRVATILFSVMEALLGHEVQLEPSMTAFLLNPPVREEERTCGAPETKIGGNFGWPHRDYNFSESNFADGSPKCLTVWIPVNDATLDNGCMYVVPKEFDAEYSLDGEYGHMRPAVQGNDRLATELRFQVTGARALPARAGTMLSWHGNLVHWGSPCHRTAHTPRASLSFAYRRADVEVMRTKGHQSIQQSDVGKLSLDARLMICSQSILIYKSWFTQRASLPEDAVPALTRNPCP